MSEARRKQRPRILPSLLIQGEGLYKTKKFLDPRYVGDPINAVKIFNDSEVDELLVIDIAAGDRGPDFEKIAQLTNECFMPICYGGGIRTREQAEKIFSLGVEKVSINTALATHPEIITEISRQYGAQSVVACLDIKRPWLRAPQIFVQRGTKSLKMNVKEAAQWVVSLGAGEIVLHDIDREGTGTGYDLALISEVAQAVSVPVIALGGAGNLNHFKQAIDAGASACAAGSLFVFHGPLQAVLINYPTQKALRELLQPRT